MRFLAFSFQKKITQPSQPGRQLLQISMSGFPTDVETDLYRNTVHARMRRRTVATLD